MTLAPLSRRSVDLQVSSARVGLKGASRLFGIRLFGIGCLAVWLFVVTGGCPFPS